MTEPQPLKSLPTWSLSRAAASSHRILHRRLGEAGFTGYEYRVLAAVVAAAHLSQAEIGRAASLDPRDVTHTVRRLEQRGLLTRTPSSANARIVTVQMSPEGLHAWRRLHAVMLQIQREVFAPLQATEIRTLIELLDRIGGESRA
ncbi:MarR family winged helix-turn-helix transcriptional regulator [Microbacterium ulmi]|uniref:MarR family transcriptional regulator n=1 Tax=Microbacterium ulmi TaxID=179095 RepID=A0A7Y2M2M2_9MICO|nr:MarR family transcriptional regulator [Microbacterium ulmi]NII68981.1 DNA-binding MarR family transcriptional regulator [Microbacterium ulmi]NNH03963.1 MarR family transcriptional regulator [Microbacterium ulmi]